MFSHSNVALSECALRAGTIYWRVDTLTSSFVCFSAHLDFFKAPLVSRDGRSDEMEVMSTPRATVPQKCCIFSDLDDYLRDFLGEISSTDHEDNFSLSNFGTESDSAPNRPRNWYPWSTQPPENAKVLKL